MFYARKLACRVHWGTILLKDELAKRPDAWQETTDVTESSKNDRLNDLDSGFNDYRTGVVQF